MFAGNEIMASKGLIHYAIIYIDTEGQIHRHVSPSIAGFENSIFTSRTTAAFVEAGNGEAQPSGNTRSI